MNKDIKCKKNIENKLVHLKQIVTYWNSFCHYLNLILIIDKYKKSKKIVY